MVVCRPCLLLCGCVDLRLKTGELLVVAVVCRPLFIVV